MIKLICINDNIHYLYGKINKESIVLTYTKMIFLIYI